MSNEARGKREKFTIEQRGNNEKRATEAQTKPDDFTIEQRANRENLSNEQLVMRIKAGENTADNMLQLYEQVKAFIYSIAWRYRAYEDLDDLNQEGYLALYDAIDGYDPDTGNKFLTYAAWNIRQRIQRYIQDKGSSLRVPVHRQDKVQQYGKLCNQFMLESGRMPNDWETAESLNLSYEQAGRIKDLSVTSKLASLDTPIKGADGGEDTVLGDMVADPQLTEDEIIDRIQQEQLEVVLWGCVDGLENRQPGIIRKRYLENKTLQQIAEDYGVTREAVRQHEAKALRELRKPRNSRRLRPFLPETSEIYSMALTGSGAGRFQRTWTSSTERVALDRIDWIERRLKNLELLERVRNEIVGTQPSQERSADSSEPF